MGLRDFDWPSMLDPKTAAVPHDLTFNVYCHDTGQLTLIKAHRLLLSIVSPVFRVQFYGMMKDERELIDIEYTHPVAFKSMIQFIYTGDSSFVADLYSQHNAESRADIILAALMLGDQYQLDDFVDICESTLFHNITSKNFWKIWSFSSDICGRLGEICDKLIPYLVMYMPEISKCEQFQQLQASHVKKVLSSTRLMCEERDVWSAAASWCKEHDQQKCSVMETIHHDLIGTDFHETESVEESVLLSTSKHSNTLPVPLRCREDTGFIVGFSVSSLGLLQMCVFNANTNSLVTHDVENVFDQDIQLTDWASYDHLYVNNHYQELVSIGANIYFFKEFTSEGGAAHDFSNFRECRELICLNLNTLKSFRGMPATQGYIVESDGLLYAVHQNGEVNRYLPQVNQWCVIWTPADHHQQFRREPFGMHSMHGHERMLYWSYPVIMTSYQGKLYIKVNSQSEINVFNTHEECWDANLPEHKYIHDDGGIVAINGYIVISGSHDSNSEKVTFIEAYSLRTCQWYSLPEVRISPAPALKVVNGKLFAVQFSDISSIAEFDDNKFSWIKYPLRHSAVLNVLPITTIYRSFLDSVTIELLIDNKSGSCGTSNQYEDIDFIRRLSAF